MSSLRVRTSALLVLLSLSVALEAGPQQPAAPPGASPASSEAPMYRLMPGDTVDVKFDYVPELNDSVKLRPDGFISLQRIGEVRAQHLTPAELTEVLKARYASLLKRPDLTVIVRDFVLQQTYVGGEVMQPGIVPLRGDLSALQAILATGGPRPSARLSEVVLIRDLGDNRAEARKLDLTQVLSGRAEDPPLQPFDVIFVPRTKIAKAGLFVEQYINALVPRSIFFPYNLDTLVIDRIR